MTDLIVIAGAPGSGKTTVSKLLWKRLDNPPIIDFGTLQDFHLDRAWSNWSKSNESIAFENVLFIVRNYIRHGFRNIIVNDFQDFRIRQMPGLFSKRDYVIITLFSSNSKELTSRIKRRKSGFTNAKKAVIWNDMVIRRRRLKNEHKIDTYRNTPAQTVRKILTILKRAEKR
jgi:broad-specificity NMP kinase